MSLLSGQFVAAPKSEGLPLDVFLFMLLVLAIIIFFMWWIVRRGGGGGGSYPSTQTFGNPYGGSTWTDFNTGSGSFGGFGGGSGGGFGGFGGGSFGGGGASGSW